MEKTNPTGHGMKLFFTADNKFIMKTIFWPEFQYFQSRFLIGYYLNLTQNPNSLLTRLYGLYTFVNPGLGTANDLQFVVMGNIMPTNRKMEALYDLKGSTYHRKVRYFDLNIKSPPDFCFNLNILPCRQVTRKLSNQHRT